MISNRLKEALYMRDPHPHAPSTLEEAYAQEQAAKANERIEVGQVCKSCKTKVKTRWSGIACDCGLTTFCY